MLLLEQRSAARKGWSEEPRQRRIRIVAPSAVRGDFPEFVDEVPYGVFGKLGLHRIKQPKPECTHEIARWLDSRPDSESREAQEAGCAAENPTWFESWSTLTLFERSLRLPQGEVVVHCVQDPVRLMDDPPDTVNERWTQAIMKYPGATGYYIEPFFDRPQDAEAKALTAGELRIVIRDQWDQLYRKSKRWHWLFRAERRVSRCLQWLDDRRKQGERRRALKAQSDLYLEMLRGRQEATQPIVSQVVDRRSTERLLPIDLRMAQQRLAARQQREARGAGRQEAQMWLNQLGQINELVGEEMRSIEARARQLRTEFGGRGQVDYDEARIGMSRRDFSVALMMGIVAFPSARFIRIDPIAAIQLPDESCLRLVGHWDRWLVPVHGVMQMQTFVHV